MQQLWGMIRTMKTIIMAGLVEIPMPAHALVFMQGCVTLAQMDVLDGAGLYQEVFEFKQTAYLTPNYELFGISNKNFIMNSGSYFLLFISFFVINILMYITNKVAVYCAHRPFCRKIGIKVYSSQYREDTIYA
jgi:hypothetical protein